jgi:hypothetical protein
MEICKEPIEMGNGDVLLTEEHTIADILRYAIKCSHFDTVKYLVNEMATADGEST